MSDYLPMLLFCLQVATLANVYDDIQVYEMETSYLQDPGQCGNVLKGFDGFLSASKSTALYERLFFFTISRYTISLSVFRWIFLFQFHVV